VTESQSPLDAAMDLFIYAPLGLVLTAAEEIPKLAAKGRAQIGGQLSIAKAVGQFAATQGRKELGRRFSPGSGGSAGTGGSAGSGGVPAGAGAGEADVVGPDRSFEDLLATADPEAARADGHITPGGSPRVAPGGPLRRLDGPLPSPDGLAIPGYDSLAASQVVQRLAGLSADELAAVGAYEAAHRGRRTILTRVRQLQGS